MKHPRVDFYFSKERQWQDEIKALRSVVLECALTEELKWGVPCYTFRGSNIVIIHVFKEYCALLFVKGALLNDTHSMLIRQSENVQAARQMRFTDVTTITANEAILKAYIYQAVEVEKAGLKVPMKKVAEFAVAEEFREKLEAMPSLKAAFGALTPGRQRAYLLHFAQAKQSATRKARVEKWIPYIMEGKGLND